MKKVLLSVLSMVLVAAISIGATLAYLQDSNSDVNVMTLGNVYIEQIEQQRVDDNANQTTLEAFENDKPLYPAVFEGSSIPWAPENEWVIAGDQAWKVVADNANVVDKFVTVKNTGKTDAYVRTLIAYEGDVEYGPNGDWIHIVTNGSNVTPGISINTVGYITVDGVSYTVFEYVYPESLAAGETSIPSLKQVYMNNKADNDIVAYYGETYDILVLSQAVQAAGFADPKTALDTAFGKPSEKAAEWFAGVWEEAHAIQYTPVASQDELTAALNDSKNPILTTDITISSPAQVGAGVTFNGDGNTISSPNVAVNVAGGSILNTNMIGTDFPVAKGGIGSVQYAGTTLEEDITIENVNISGFANAIDLDAAGNTVYVKDSELQNSIHIAYADEIVFENCHFTALNNQFIKTGNIYIYGNMKFVNCHFEENVNFFLDMQGLSGTLEFENCTYGNNGVEDRPFEPSVGFFTWWMNAQTYGTFNEGNPARTNFTCIVDGTVVWSAS